MLVSMAGTLPCPVVAAANTECKHCFGQLLLVDRIAGLLRSRHAPCGEGCDYCRPSVLPEHLAATFLKWDSVKLSSGASKASARRSILVQHVHHMCSSYVLLQD